MRSSRHVGEPGRPYRCVAGLLAGWTIIAGPAIARADDQAVAEDLLDRGRGLMRNQATLDEGCKLLEESIKLMDRGDTMLNLAECHRRQGKTATAFAEFQKALSVGSQIGFGEAVEAAARRRDELATRLSKLTVTVPPAALGLEELAIEVDGRPWPRERWNAAVAVDPGDRRVEARAKGYKPFLAHVDIGVSKDSKTVVLELEPLPPPAPPPLPPPPPPPPTRPIWPWIVGAGGLVLGAAAIGAEVVSLNAHSELDANCGGPKRNDCHPPFDFNGARTRELVGFGFFLGLGASSVVALGAAGVGLGLSARSRAPGASLLLSPTSVGVRTTF